jgi:general secretion pathway protein G
MLSYRTFSPENRANRPQPARWTGDERGKKAFTLIELLTVILIMGILMSMIIGIAVVVGQKNLEARALADIENIRNALNEHQLDYGKFPASTLADDTWTNDISDYMALEGFNYIDPWDNAYLYETPASASSPRSYTLYSLGRDGEEGTEEKNADNIVAGR